MGYKSVSEFWALKIIFSCLFFKFLAESGLLVLCWFRTRGSSLGPISFKNADWIDGAILILIYQQARNVVDFIQTCILGLFWHKTDFASFFFSCQSCDVKINTSEIGP